jgi:hypothetical protein
MEIMEFAEDEFAESYARGYLAVSKIIAKIYQFYCLQKYILDGYLKTRRQQRRSLEYSEYSLRLRMSGGG